MISSENKFYITIQTVTSKEHKSYIIDWDQRRWYVVCGPTSVFPEDGGKEIDVLKRYINQIPQGVYDITVDEHLNLIATGSDEDPTLLPCYPRLSDSPSLQDCTTIKLSELQELDRFGPGVDLEAYHDGTTTRKVVFKYSIIHQWVEPIWNEMHIVQRLKHLNIVPFDRVVIDDNEARVLGFTTRFIPGGTLDQVRDRTFRFEWLQQLTSVIDWLNLEIGIVHQDVAPRNILINPETNKIQLFDFDRSAEVSQAYEPSNDVKGLIFTLYEIITEDTHFREVPHEEQDPQQVMTLDQWPLQCKLDHDVTRFREHLNDWVARRTTVGFIPRQVTEIIAPCMPPSSPVPMGYDEAGETVFAQSKFKRRNELLKENKNVVIWERPPQQQGFAGTAIQKNGVEP